MFGLLFAPLGSTHPSVSREIARSCTLKDALEGVVENLVCGEFGNCVRNDPVVSGIVRRGSFENYPTVSE